MIKRLISLAVCFVLLLGAFSFVAMASADKIHTGMMSSTVRWEFNETTSTLTLVGLREVSHTLLYTPRRLPEYIVKFGDKIKHVVITEGIYSLGDCNFYGCAVEDVEMPYVEQLHESVFEGCKSLKKIEFSSDFYGIQNRAFYGCSSLENVKLPERLVVLGEEAFAECDSLREIIVPWTVLSLPSSTFAGCDSLEKIDFDKRHTKYSVVNNCIINKDTHTVVFGCKSSVIPTNGSVTAIGPKAFDGCVGLEKIVIPSSVKEISDYAFNNCTGLKEVTMLGGNLECVSPRSFYGATALEKIDVLRSDKYYTKDNCLIDDQKTLLLGCKTSVIPSDGSVNRIGEEAFVACSALKKIVIPEAIEEVGCRAFAECTGLEEITLSVSVINALFSGCTSLATVRMAKPVAEIKSASFDNCTALERVVICCTKDELKDIVVASDYAKGASTFEISRHESEFVQINYQMHAMHCQTCGSAEGLEPHSVGLWKYQDTDDHNGVCICGVTIKEAHTWELIEDSSFPATKKKAGLNKYYCSVCDSERSEEIPKLGGCESLIGCEALSISCAVGIALVIARRKKNSKKEPKD